MVRDLDRKIIGKFVTRKFGEHICELDSSENAKMWTFVFHMIAHQRVRAADDEFNNQACRMTDSVDTI